MSTVWVATLWRSSVPRAQRERLLLLALADLADADGVVQTTLEVLSGMCRMRPRTVMLLLEVLERTGFIERMDRPGALMYRLAPGSLGEACV